MTQAIHTPKQQKWLTKLIGYNFEIIYKPGKENIVVNVLSRVQEAPAKVVFAAVSSPSCPLIY